MTVIADCRGFLQQASFMSTILFHVDSLLFFPLLPLLDCGKSVFIICQDWYVNPFAPDPSLEMLWVLLEEWLLSYLATSLWGLYTSIRRIPSGKDWIWYPGQYLGIRSLSTFCLFLLFHCTPPPPPFPKCVCVCCWFRSFFHFVFLFQQHFPLSLRPTKFMQRTNVSRVTQQQRPNHLPLGVTGVVTLQQVPLISLPIAVPVSQIFIHTCARMKIFHLVWSELFLGNSSFWLIIQVI